MAQSDRPLSRAECEAADWLVRIQLDHGFAQTEFERWRAADPENAAAFAALKASDAKTDIGARLELVRASRLRRASFFERKPGTSYALAAGLALLIFGGAGLGLREAGSLGAPTQVGQTLAFSTGAEEVRTVTLIDGSKVTLDAGTRLHISFTGDVRRLRLDTGRARFEVAHDPRRPFIVSAGDGNVIAHGTVFDVSVGPTGVHVVLLRGAIEVTKQNDTDRPAADGASRHLVPGQQVTFDKAHPIPAPQSAAPGELRWTAGILSFENARLVDAVAELNRHSPRKIMLASLGIADLRISGGFRAGEVDKFAQVMAATFGLRPTSRPDGIALSAGEDQPDTL